jgi:SecD/SecF fusion protein
MFHDVAILIGVFAWLGKELDGVFIASLLTVIGYSVNDSVVVFDRIREQRRARAREPLEVVANDACLQTIPRTVNTGLGALFILVALWLLGGETLADFALALLIGILVGTYSSVFTAAPVAVSLEGRWPATPAPPARPERRRPARPRPTSTTPRARRR